jgi:hypothetical protein
VALSGLTCSLKPTPDGHGRYGLRFGIHDGGPEPVTLTWWQPFLNFDLTAATAEGEARIVRPAFDTGVQLVTEQVAPGGTLWLETPIQLSFDPDVPPSGGPDPTVWTIVHPPTPVEVSAVLHLPDGDLRCAAVLHPEAPGEAERHDPS